LLLISDSIEAMPEHFNKLLRIVIEDSTAMPALTSAETKDALFALVIELGRDRGIELSLGELEEVARANRKAWLERWLVL